MRDLTYLPWERETVGFVSYISQFGLLLNLHFSGPRGHHHQPLSFLFSNIFSLGFFSKKTWFLCVKKHVFSAHEAWEDF